MNMSTTSISSLIVDQLITYADWFFPGEIDFDRDLEIGIVNGSEPQVIGMRRCVSNSSLSDHGESPPQGSPKPAARRKNKPAPTPPSGTTPDKNDKKCDDKPPPAPDKPPRPLMSATLNRATYKAQKHEVNTELLTRHENNVEKIDKNSDVEIKHIGFEGIIAQVDIQPADNCESVPEMNTSQSELAKNNVDTEKYKLDALNAELQKSEKRNVPVSIDKTICSLENVQNKSSVDIDNSDVISARPKPLPTEKPAPSTLERRRPVAAPRNITNITHNTGPIICKKRKELIFY